MKNILNFPQTSFIDRLLPKAKFVQASDTPTKLREFLTQEFEQLRLLYVLRADTLNVEPGNEVKEIDVFYFRTKENGYSINQLCGLDALIPRHSLYVIEYDGKFDVLMQHKHRSMSAGQTKWKCEVSHLQREVTFDELDLRIEGHNMDAVYVNLLVQLEGKKFDSIDDYQKKTAEAERRAKLEKQITSLEVKARRETQPRKKFELVQQLKELKKQL